MTKNEKIITMITGTSRGIGRSLADHYLEQGHVVLGLSRSRPDLNNENYHHFDVDISNEDAVREIFLTVSKKFGYLNHLINNAGVSSLNHSLLTPLSTVKKITEINFFAPFLLSQEAARLMRSRKTGRIVNFSTISVPLRSEGVAAYAASKAAVEELTRILAKELGPMGITVNCVGPSVLDTNLAHGIPEHRQKELLAQQSVRREARMDDVANVVDFFLSPRSEMISGQVIYLGGFG